MKIVNVGYGRQVSTVIIESIHVFANRAGIKNMLVYNPSADESDNNVESQGKQGKRQGGSLVVVSDNEVRSIPLHYCDRVTTCLGCVRMQDPYCAWDMRSGSCVGVTSG